MKTRIIQFCLTGWMLCLNAGADPTKETAHEPTTFATAKVRDVKNQASYVQHGESKKLKSGVELPPGTTVRTGSKSEVLMSVNGVTSTFQIGPSSELSLDTMNRTGSGPAHETETILNLKNGTIAGQIKKISGNSKFEIHTPNGTAAIRGTDVYVHVEPVENGAPKVTFLSLAGTVVVSAGVDGKSESVALHDGQQCVTGSGDLAVNTASREVQEVAAGMIPHEMSACPFPFTPRPSPGIIQPFDGNGPPRLVNVPLAPTHR